MCSGLMTENIEKNIHTVSDSASAIAEKVSSSYVLWLLLLLLL